MDAGPVFARDAAVDVVEKLGIIAYLTNTTYF